MPDWTPKNIAYLRRLVPVLDSEGKFIFIGNHKCAQLSINRRLLKHRAVIRKDNETRYDKLFDSYDFDKAYAFTVVRNPFDRAVSAFFYLQKVQLIGQDMEFESFVARHNLVEYDIHFHTMTDRVFSPDGILVDSVIRLEKINREWCRVAEKINCLGQVPHINQTKHKPYPQYYENEETIRKISDTYADDIAIFGYSFGR